VPERDPEVASVELRSQAADRLQDRADYVRRWWRAMARSHATLAKPICSPQKRGEISAVPKGLQPS
jgi:hypothetical protein